MNYFRFNTKEPERFYALEKEKEYDDSESFSEAFYDDLRRKKLKEEAEEQEKERFVRTNIEYNEQYGKLNKKFLQMMGSKTYYYSDQGEAIEITPNKQAKLLKKKRLPGKARSKLEVEKVIEKEVEKPTEKFVEFAEKENILRYSKDEFEVGRPMTLFYKSENCSYQVVS